MTQIPAFNPVDTAIQSRTTSQFQEMTSEDFIRIMFTELSNQDPFQPNDSAVLLEQLNSIRSIEADIGLQDKLEALVTGNQLASASNMIGKLVGGLTLGNDRVAGTVISVVRQGDDVSVELDNGFILPIGRVEIILDASALDDLEPEPTPDPDVPVPVPVPDPDPTDPDPTDPDPDPTDPPA